jgi:hypothetical protein
MFQQNLIHKIFYLVWNIECFFRICYDPTITVMKLRFILPALLAIISLNLFAQPEIVNITYEGGVAILKVSQPPDGIIYYWQGTSCGTLMNNSSSTTVATSNGTYYVKEYYSTGAAWATSCASTVVMIPDETPPVLSNVTAGPINAGTDVLATSNENGMVYLVPDGTAADLVAIDAAKVAEAASTENVAVSLETNGLPEGDYIVYAVDGSDNISVASPAITVTWATFIDLGTASSDQVQLYPANVKDILHIKSNIQVSSATVYSLQGAQMIKINTAVDQIDMSSLNAGVYIVRLTLENNTLFNGKVTKR